MPILQVFAPPVDDAAAKLEAMCREAASALGLQPADVVATHVHVDQTVIPGSDRAVWPIVVIHGSARAEQEMQHARDRVAVLASSWCPSGAEGAWVTWQLPR